MTWCKFKCHHSISCPAIPPTIHVSCHSDQVAPISLTWRPWDVLRNVQITCAHCHAHYRRHQDPSATLWALRSPDFEPATPSSGVLHLRCSPRARFSSLLFVFCCEHLILNATGKLCPHIKLTLLVFGATKRPRSGAKIEDCWQFQRLDTQLQKLNALIREIKWLLGKREIFG